jgi:hypothetical protein
VRGLLSALLAAYLCSGCPRKSHDDIEEIVGPDGGKLYEMSCHGRDVTLGHCLNAVAEHCGGPYEVLDRERSQDGSVTSSSNGFSSTKQVGHVSLIYRCK